MNSKSQFRAVSILSLAAAFFVVYCIGYELQSVSEVFTIQGVVKYLKIKQSVADVQLSNSSLTFIIRVPEDKKDSLKQIKLKGKIQLSYLKSFAKKSAVVAVRSDKCNISSSELLEQYKNNQLPLVLIILFFGGGALLFFFVSLLLKEDPDKNRRSVNSALGVQMNSVSNQIFRIKSSYVRETKVASSLFFIAAAVVSGTPFLPGEEPVDFLVTIAILVPFLISLGFYGFYIAVKQIPFSNVKIDKDGIWYEHLKKEEGIVPWESIRDIKEDPFWKRVILIDREGIPLMKIEYQLSNFDSLRLILADKCRINSKAV